MGTTALGALPDSVASPKTEAAQKFLVASVQSVSSTLWTFDLLRDQRRREDGTLPQGRLTDAEEDQLRSAVIFAGAGLDTSLKQLLRDATFAITSMDSAANTKLHRFAVRYLSEGEIGVNPTRLARILLTPGLTLPRETLIEEYINDLTGDSLQSAAQVRNTCEALSVSDTKLRKRLKDGATLDKMFRARNEMIHELDLLRDKSPGPGVRLKRGRKIGESRDWATEALAVAQTIINSVAVRFVGSNG